MRIEREEGASTSSPPFLSIVTRCYKRPTMLAANRESIEAQTVADYEHIMIIDDVGHGLHAANQSLAQAEPRGDYVLILDDDDLLTDPAAIEALQEVVQKEDAPALVFFKADHQELGTLPDSTVWGHRPIHGHVGSCDFITRRDVWEKYIHAFGAPESGDYHYLKAVWYEAPRVAWLDRKLAAVQRISWGKPE